MLVRADLLLPDLETIILVLLEVVDQAAKEVVEVGLEAQGNHLHGVEAEVEVLAQYMDYPQAQL
jgi:hypothetical protein